MGSYVFMAKPNFSLVLLWDIQIYEKAIWINVCLDGKLFPFHNFHEFAVPRTLLYDIKCSCLLLMNTIADNVRF
jgi:hypothetical protein